MSRPPSSPVGRVSAVLLACGLGFVGCYGSLLREAPDGGVLACAEGSMRCAGACIDVRVDDANCGACGRACQGGQVCGGSTCYSKDCSDQACGPEQLCTFKGCVARRCVDVDCDGGTCNDAGVCTP